MYIHCKPEKFVKHKMGKEVMVKVNATPSAIF